MSDSTGGVVEKNRRRSVEGFGEMAGAIIGGQVADDFKHTNLTEAKAMAEGVGEGGAIPEAKVRVMVMKGFQREEGITDRGRGR